MRRGLCLRHDLRGLYLRHDLRGQCPCHDLRGLYLRHDLRGLLTLLLLSAIGCAAEPSYAPADVIVDAPGADGSRFGDPTRAVNGVRGAGMGAGSLDVYSLNYTTRPSLVIGFGAYAVTDGPGADLAVFENGFLAATDEAYTFMDPIVLEVSSDGVAWLAFPFDYVNADERAYVPHPELWEGFAGTLPVRVNEDTDALDPFSAMAGGNAFDLADLGSGEAALRARREGIRYVRLRSAAIVTNPDTGEPFPRDAVSDGADIDGVIGRYLVRANALH